MEIKEYLKMKETLCKHEINPFTLKYKKGFSKGKCIKCGCNLTRIYPTNQNPKRIKPKMTKKERKRLWIIIKEEKMKEPRGRLEK